jgi:hypothetical protein
MKEDEIGRACSTNIFVGKPEEKRPLGRHRRRCENNIKTGLKETVWKGVN